MRDERLGLKAHVLAIDADHLERLEALRQTGQVAHLNSFDMIGMDAGRFAHLLEAEAALLALALEIPACFARRIEVSVGLRAEERCRIECGIITLMIGGKNIHGALLQTVGLNQPVTLM